MKYFILLLALTLWAGQIICTSGKVLVADRKGNIWKGEPTELVIACIDDSQYIYYQIIDPVPELFRNINKRILFCGKVKVKIIQDTIKQYFIDLKDFQFER